MSNNITVDNIKEKIWQARSKWFLRMPEHEFNNNLRILVSYQTMTALQHSDEYHEINPARANDNNWTLSNIPIYEMHGPDDWFKLVLEI